MKILRQLCAASMLTLALALSAFAGQIDTMITTPPPPQQSATQATTAGDISTGLTATTTEITFSLIQSVLTLI